MEPVIAERLAAFAATEHWLKIDLVCPKLLSPWQANPLL